MALVSVRGLLVPICYLQPEAAREYALAKATEPIASASLETTCATEFCCKLNIAIKRIS